MDTPQRFEAIYKTPASVTFLLENVLGWRGFSAEVTFPVTRIATTGVRIIGVFIVSPSGEIEFIGNYTDTDKWNRIVRFNY